MCNSLCVIASVWLASPSWMADGVCVAKYWPCDLHTQEQDRCRAMERADTGVRAGQNILREGDSLCGEGGSL